MSLKSNYIRNGHLATILYHIFTAFLIYIYTKNNNKRGVYIVDSVFLAVSILALYPIMSKSYICTSYQPTDLIST